MSDRALTNPKRWWEPVDEASSPELTERIGQGARWFMGVALALRALFWVAWAAAIGLRDNLHLLAPAAALVLSAALTWAIRRARSTQLLSGVLLLQEALVWLSWTTCNISGGSLSVWNHAQVLMISLLICMVPIRPTLLLALGASQGWWLFLELGYSDQHLALRAALGGLGLGFGVLAATFSQVQRHLLRLTGQQQRQYLARERLVTLGDHTAQRLAQVEAPLAAALARLQGLHALEAPRALPQGELERARADLHKVREALDECAQRLHQLHRQTQRLGQHEVARLDLPQALQAALFGQQRALREAQLTPSVHQGQGATLEGDPQKLAQLLEALLSALAGCAQGPTPLTISVTHLRGEASVAWRVGCARAPAAEEPELALARDLARGFFGGELSWAMDGASLLMTLTLAAGEGAVEGAAAFTPAFCAQRDVERSHASP